MTGSPLLPRVGAAEPGGAADLPGVLARLAAELPPSHRQAWSRALQASPRPGPQVEAQLISAWPGGSSARLAHALLRAWTATKPTPDGAAITLALQAAARAHTAAAESHRVDLVASGPTTAAVPVRSTDQVVAEVIRAAHHRLLVVSFAAYHVPRVVTELRAAADRGVHLDIVLESSSHDGGPLRHDARSAFPFLAADFWHWPTTERPVPAAGRPSLHAKLVAADDHTALLGSANLTGQALMHNLEIGVVLRDPDVVGRLVSHFRTLMTAEHGVLRRL